MNSAIKKHFLNVVHWHSRTIKSSDSGAHAGSDNGIDDNVMLFKTSQYAYFCHGLARSTRKGKDKLRMRFRKISFACAAYRGRWRNLTGRSVCRNAAFYRWISSCELFLLGTRAQR